MAVKNMGGKWKGGKFGSEKGKEAIEGGQVSREGNMSPALQNAIRNVSDGKTVNPSTLTKEEMLFVENEIRAGRLNVKPPQDEPRQPVRETTAPKKSVTVKPPTEADRAMQERRITQLQTKEAREGMTGREQTEFLRLTTPRGQYAPKAPTKIATAAAKYLNNISPNMIGNLPLKTFREELKQIMKRVPSHSDALQKLAKKYAVSGQGY